MSMLGDNESEDNAARNRLTALSEQNKANIEQQKIQLAREQMMADAYSKAADRQVKREDIKSKEKIARTNKNKYDK